MNICSVISQGLINFLCFTVSCILPKTLCYSGLSDGIHLKDPETSRTKISLLKLLIIKYLQENPLILKAKSRGKNWLGWFLMRAVRKGSIQAALINL